MRLCRLAIHLASTDIAHQLTGEPTFFAFYAVQMRDAAAKYQSRCIDDCRHAAQISGRCSRF
jgi:hypothetical protein